jgi:hypothetical protein
VNWKNWYYKLVKMPERKFGGIMGLSVVNRPAKKVVVCAASVFARSTRSTNESVPDSPGNVCCTVPSQVRSKWSSPKFEPRRNLWKRGIGAGSKAIFFGILKRKVCVYTVIVPDVSGIIVPANDAG